MKKISPKDWAKLKRQKIKYFADEKTAKDFISKRISPVFYSNIESNLPDLVLERITHNKYLVDKEEKVIVKI